MKKLKRKNTIQLKRTKGISFWACFLLAAPLCAQPAPPVLVEKPHAQWKTIHSPEVQFFVRLYQDDVIGDTLVVNGKTYFFSQSPVKQFSTFLLDQDTFIRDGYSAKDSSGTYDKGYVLHFSVDKDGTSFVDRGFFSGTVHADKQPNQPLSTYDLQRILQTRNSDARIPAQWLNGQYRVNTTRPEAGKPYKGQRLLAVFENGKFKSIRPDQSKEDFNPPLVDLNTPSDSYVYYPTNGEKYQQANRAEAAKKWRDRIFHTMGTEPFLDRACVHYLKNLWINPNADTTKEENQLPEGLRELMRIKRLSSPYRVYHAPEVSFFCNLYQDDFLGDTLVVGDKTYYFSQSSMKQFSDYMLGKTDLRIWSGFGALPTQQAHGMPDKGYVLYFSIDADGMASVQRSTYKGFIYPQAQDAQPMDLSVIAGLTGQKIQGDRIPATWLNGKYRLNDLQPDALKTYSGARYLAVFEKGKLKEIIPDQEKTDFNPPQMDLRECPQETFPHNFKPTYVYYKISDEEYKKSTAVEAVQLWREKVLYTFRTEPFLDRECVQSLQEVWIQK